MYIVLLGQIVLKFYKGVAIQALIWEACQLRMCVMHSHRLKNMHHVFPSKNI